ncbi:MAG TPA: transglutaminase-like domain-containing protein [Roseiflexaceae bacterium]|nr:transglutaminase-like domain-containing protein [Roseiflexaceae bacterium]
MQHAHPARIRFRALIRQPEPRLNLAEAALCIAWEDQGHGRPEAALRELDELAEQARPRLAGSTQPLEIVIGLNSYLFGECGFHGNTWQYNDPANSFLDRVLETRAGLPITLCVIYMEIGWRLGLPVGGVALPGHFLARFGLGPHAIFIDPFNRGRLWSQHQCETQIATFYGSATPQLVGNVMAPPTRRAILARILRNLKNLYADQEALPAALAASERILMLEPDNLEELRDRGLLRARLGQLHHALEDLDRYARMAPRAPDLPQIKQRAQMLAALAAAGN